LKSEIELEALPRLGWSRSVVYFAAKYLEPHIEKGQKYVSDLTVPEQAAALRLSKRLIEAGRDRIQVCGAVLGV